MKKLFVLAIAAMSFVACDDAENERTDVEETTTTTTSYNAEEGDVTYRDSKVKVMRNGEWVDANEDVRLDDGTVIYRDGRAKRDDREIVMEDGVVINRRGDFFDRTGRALENAWEATKEGAKDAGRAIEGAAQDVENAIDRDDRDRQ